MATQHVATQTDLANLPTPTEGELAIADDTNHLWKYVSGTWTDEGVAPQAAPAPGTAVLATATIDSLFTLMYATRSGDLGTPTYAWADSNSIIGTFPAGTTPTAVNATMMKIRFEARPNYPSVLAP